MSTGTSSSSSSEQSFDYIIVGAGPSAMGLLHGLLEPHGNNLPFSIAIVEQGPKVNGGNDDKVRNLSRWFEAAHDRFSTNVSVLSASISSLSRHLDVPLGRGVGGGSNINAGLCMAPPPSDFQDWPCPWQTDLPAAIQKIQHCLASNHCLLDAATGDELTMEDLDSCNGVGGLWNNNNDMPINREKGLGESCGRILVPCLARRKHKNRPGSNGGFVERVNYYQGLIKPRWMPSSKIHWFCNTQVQRLLLEEGSNRKVLGVEVMMAMNAEGKFSRFLARKEVILCAGAIETPALLMVSGIGGSIQPGKHDSGETETSDARALQGIGENLRDHVILPRVLFGPPPFWRSTINGIHNINDITIDNNHFLILISTTTPEIALHYMVEIFRRYFFGVVASNWAIIWWTLEQILRCLVLYTPIYWVVKYGFTTINLALVNPQSKGTIGLAAKCNKSSNDNSIAPPRRKDFTIDLDLGYLQHPGDSEALWQGWVASSVVFDSLFNSPVWEVYPGGIFRLLHGWFGGHNHPSTSAGSNPNRQSSTLVPKWFSQYDRDHCLPFFHWCGTCAMKTSTNCSDNGNGDNDDWVVDANMRVRSFRSLRVCDASVFLNNLSAPPALTCAAMGYVLGNMIRKQEQTRQKD